MAVISASAVKELRMATGLGMMECKRALQEAEGDLKKAEDLLRVRSGSKATKVAGRIAAEGAIGISMSDDLRKAAIVEINCETDFVGKDESFLDFVLQVAEVSRKESSSNINDLVQKKLGVESIESVRQNLVMKLGENITIRRVAVVDAVGLLSFYVHGNKIGVVIDVEGGNETLRKDLAMHIAAMKPIAISGDAIGDEVLERERQVARGRAIESGKKPDIIEKIVQGSVRKYLEEVTLLGQGATVHAFQLFVVGEGIEKKTVDFVAEVEAQASKI